MLITSLKEDREFDDLRSDQRFKDLLHRINLPLQCFEAAFVRK